MQNAWRNRTGAECSGRRRTVRDSGRQCADDSDHSWSRVPWRRGRRDRRSSDDRTFDAHVLRARLGWTSSTRLRRGQRGLARRPSMPTALAVDVQVPDRSGAGAGCRPRLRRATPRELAIAVTIDPLGPTESTRDRSQRPPIDSSGRMRGVEPSMRASRVRGAAVAGGRVDDARRAADALRGEICVRAP